MIKPLNLKKSNIPVKSVMQEILKAKEEDGEFYEGVQKRDIENAIEEFYDSIQAKINILDMLGVSIAEVENGEIKHIDKMKKRKYVFKEG